MAKAIRAEVALLVAVAFCGLVAGQLSEPITRDEHVLKDNDNKFLSRHSTDDKEIIPEM